MLEKTHSRVLKADQKERRDCNLGRLERVATAVQCRGCARQDGERGRVSAGRTATAPKANPGQTVCPAGRISRRPTEVGRDVAIDLLRGLAMVILVINHMHLQSALGYLTATVISAAEVLVLVSGVVSGMVFGRRWHTHGRRATTEALFARARKLYLATVVVSAIIGLLVLMPWVPTDAVTASPNMRPGDNLYDFDGPAQALLAIVTLAAGPWQLSILGLFIVLLAVTPAILYSFERGWWPWVLSVSWLLFTAGRLWPVDVLPAQSERAFPILIWQTLFVHGMALGYYRRRIESRIRAWRRPLVGTVCVLAFVSLAVRLQLGGLNLSILDGLIGFGPGDWQRWETAHFDKTSLDIARIVVMASLGAAVYLGFRYGQRLVQRAVGWLLLPLGRNSFYVFIMHVFVCLALATVPGVAGGGFGLLGNTMIQLGCLALLWAMVRRRFLFSVVPR